VPSLAAALVTPTHTPARRNPAFRPFHAPITLHSHPTNTSCNTHVCIHSSNVFFLCFSHVFRVFDVCYLIIPFCFTRLEFLCFESRYHCCFVFKNSCLLCGLPLWCCFFAVLCWNFQKSWLFCFVPPGDGHFGLFYRQAVAPSSARCCKLAPGARVGGARRWPLFLASFFAFHVIVAWVVRHQCYNVFFGIWMNLCFVF